MERATFTEETLRVHSFDNGLTVLLEPLPYLHSVSMGVWVQTGSAFEPAETSGISHFLEHLLFKGTETRSARDLASAIEGVGGSIDAFTSREYTCVYTRTLDTQVDMAVTILADVYKHSRLHDIEKERNVILEEIATLEDVPEELVHELYAQLHWPGHPLGRSILGTVDTVTGMQQDALRAYYEHWYRPAHTIIAAAGNFDPDVLLAQLAEEFEGLPTGGNGEACTRPSLGTGVTYQDSAIGQHHVCIGFPGPSATDPRRFAYSLLSNVLGGGCTSRLFERIREDEGLAYAVYTFHSYHAEAGTLGVYAAVAPANLDKTVAIICEELVKLREEPLSDEELHLNREQLKGSILLSLEGTFNRMSRLAQSVMVHGRVVPVEELVAGVDAVTSEDIQAAAGASVGQDRCTAVFLGPATTEKKETLPL
jgi:predicted Zn-dependent peptidase